MLYRLSSHRHAVIIDDRVIVLDVDRDRYLLLREPAARAIRALGQGDLAEPGISRLSTLGVLDTGAFRATPRTVPAPMCSAIERDDNLARKPGFITVAMGVTRAMLGLRIRGLAAMLGNVERAAGAVSHLDAGALALAQRFARHRLRLPLRNICLAESLALHGFLSANGHSASFVIGVRLNPFGAHCWLQVDDCVLNDSCDHASQFMPILVL